MTIDKVLVSIIGSIIIVGIYMFFFSKKEDEAQESNGEIDILVDGGYKPQRIKVKLGKSTLHFLRKDPSSCLEEVVLPDFGKKIFLPLNKKTTIEINADKKGEFEMSCGMNMFHGKIIVQ